MDMMGEDNGRDMDGKSEADSGAGAKIKTKDKRAGYCIGRRGGNSEFMCRNILRSYKIQIAICISSMAIFFTALALSCMCIELLVFSCNVISSRAQWHRKVLNLLSGLFVILNPFKIVLSIKRTINFESLEAVIREKV